MGRTIGARGYKSLTPEERAARLEAAREKNLAQTNARNRRQAQDPAYKAKNIRRTRAWQAAHPERVKELNRQRADRLKNDPKLREERLAYLRDYYRQVLKPRRLAAALT